MVGFKKELLDTFLKLGYISSEAVQALSARSVEQGISIIEAAIQEDLLHSDAKGWLLAEFLGIPWGEIDPDSVPMSLCEVLPESFARENLVVPIARDNERLTLAVADPFRHEIFSEIRRMTGAGVRIVICPHRTIAEILSRFYPDLLRLSPGEMAEGIIPEEEAEDWIAQGGARRVAEKALLHAASTGLASVRLFPAGRKVLLTGSGQDGTRELLTFPMRVRRLLLDAFADLAGMKDSPGTVSETVFQLESAAGITSFRLSFVQGLSGPEAIVRILPDQKSSLTLDSIGLNQEQYEITRKVLAKKGGFYLLSSPGPEGRATTLFALLREISHPGMRVATVEEQFRFRNEGYIQMEHGDVARQFAGKWTRLAESLEPDILMIETVSEPDDIAELVHLAQRGPTVLCGIRRFNFDRTLRTLLSLDVDPFLLARVVRLVLHQRLVNLLCQECRRPVPAKPSPGMVGERYREELEKIIEQSSFYVPVGCERCKGTGYSGMMALAELMPFTPGVENLVASDTWLEEKVGLLLQEDFYSAVYSVHDLIRRGMVTYDDVLPLFR